MCLVVRDKGRKGLSYCFDVLHDCFLQPTDERIFDDTSNVPLLFENNSASVSGADLYGGFVDSCAIPTLPAQYNDSGRVFNRLVTITDKPNSTVNISSNPIRICPCYRNQPACGRALSNICNSDGSSCSDYVREFEVYLDSF